MVNQTTLNYGPVQVAAAGEGHPEQHMRVDRRLPGLLRIVLSVGLSLEQDVLQNCQTESATTSADPALSGLECSRFECCGRCWVMWEPGTSLFTRLSRFLCCRGR